MMLSLPPMRQDWFRYLLLWGQAFSLTEGLTNWAKTLILRPRPLAYYYAADYPHVPVGLAEAALTTDTRFSYFSGHTSMTAVSSFFVARTFADYCPDSRAKPWVWASAALLPALVGIWRVRAGKHYPTDVLTGYLVGASVGLLIPALHRRK
jgi:membrane-associated phospholipid phosphatase